MADKIRPKHDRSVGKTFMETEFTQQACPKCETTYNLLALGDDARRNTVVCQFCAHPDFFQEEV